MKDDLNKPLYKDYKKQRAYLSYIKDPVLSIERSYTVADKPLVVFGQILMIAGVFIICSYAPRGLEVWLRGLGSLITLSLLYLVSALYARFVYRFGRFHVEWEHPLEHPYENASDNCERYGDFPKTGENGKAKIKSRRAFLIFFAAVIAAVFFFCFLGYGLAYARAYGWHRGEIEEAAQIAQKYESLFVHTWNNDITAEGWAADGGEISAGDENRLKQIFRSLQWDYADYMGSGEAYGEEPYERFTISFRGGFSNSDLVRYQDIVDISQVKNNYRDKTVTQLDEHWWYVR